MFTLFCLSILDRYSALCIRQCVLSESLHLCNFIDYNEIELTVSSSGPLVFERHLPRRDIITIKILLSNLNEIPMRACPDYSARFTRVYTAAILNLHL